MWRFLTAGESHGPALSVIIDGLPSGLQLAEDDINRDLARRQQGYGRGGRMKIEQDRVVILSGLVGAQTSGAPLSLQIEISDWPNWKGRELPGAKPSRAPATPTWQE